MKREETERDGRGASLRVRAASLEVVEGPDRGLTARVDAPVVIVGSGHGVDVILSDPTVSRAHLHLSLSSEGLRLRDEGSRNGSWIGPLRLREALTVSDVAVRMGATIMAVKVD